MSIGVGGVIVFGALGAFFAFCILGSRVCPVNFMLLYNTLLGNRLQKRRLAARELQLAEENAATFRRARGNQRGKWMREDFREKHGRQRHEERAVDTDVEDDTAPNLAVGTAGPLALHRPPPAAAAAAAAAQQRTPTSFHSLPAELRLQIYAHLNYGQALTLQNVNRFLRDDLPYEGVDREQRATFVYHAETFAKNVQADCLACFGCLRLRHRTEFLVGMRTYDFARFGVRELERRCAACELGKAGYRTGPVGDWRERVGRVLPRW